MISKNQALEIYRWLILNRTLEDRMVSLARAGRIPVNAVISRGREAACIGAACALEPGDLLASMVVCAGALLVRGIAPSQILAQAMGRASSPGGGRESAAGMGDLGRGVIAGTAMPGTLMPVVAGAAIASRIRGRASVAMALVDESQTNSTDFHEGLNFAAVRKAPVIAVVLVNERDLRSPTEEQTANPDFTTRAGSYGIEGFSADGMDALATCEVCRGAVARARSGSGPTLVIARTAKARLTHALADGISAPRLASAEARSREPIRRCESVLGEQGWLSEAARLEIRATARAEVDQATGEAERSPSPEHSSALGCVYHESR